MSTSTAFILYDAGKGHFHRYTAIPVGGVWAPTPGKNGEWRYASLNFPARCEASSICKYGDVTRGPHLGMVIPFQSLPGLTQDFIIHRTRLIGELLNKKRNGQAPAEPLRSASSR